MKKLLAAVFLSLVASTSMAAVASDVGVRLVLTENPSATTNDAYFTNKLALTNSGRLYALLTVTQNSTEAGELTVEFTAPAPTAEQAKKGEACADSTKTLKYSGKTWHTYAYRTVRHDSFTCSGVWKVRVLSKDGTELSALTYEVK